MAKLNEYQEMVKNYIPPKTAKECNQRIRQHLDEFWKIISDIKKHENQRNYK